MAIVKHSVVAFQFNLVNQDGEQLDSTEGQDPLVYLHGVGGLIPGLEAELEGKNEGDQFKVTIEPEKAYGTINPEMIKQVPIDAFAEIDDLHEGMQLQAQGPEGQVQHIVVQEINEGGVVVNANHPLAGQTLTFDISIDSIREATEEEIDHGHVHGAGGHQH